eukprot:g24621.t1
MANTDEETKPRSAAGRAVLQHAEALRAFAEGACATFAEQYQAPLMRRLALLEASLQRLQQQLQGARKKTNACRQDDPEFLQSGHDLMKAFAALVDRDEIDESSSRLQAPLMELHQAAARWRHWAHSGEL